MAPVSGKRKASFDESADLCNPSAAQRTRGTRPAEQPTASTSREARRTARTRASTTNEDSDSSIRPFPALPSGSGARASDDAAPEPAAASADEHSPPCAATEVVARPETVNVGCGFENPRFHMPDVTTARIEALLGSRYSIERVIGAGNFGTILAATRTVEPGEGNGSGQRGAPVAIKLLNVAGEMDHKVRFRAAQHSFSPRPFCQLVRPSHTLWSLVPPLPTCAQAGDVFELSGRVVELTASCAQLVSVHRVLVESPRAASDAARGPPLPPLSASSTAIELGGGANRLGMMVMDLVDCDLKVRTETGVPAAVVAPAPSRPGLATTAAVRSSACSFSRSRPARRAVDCSPRPWLARRAERHAGSLSAPLAPPLPPARRRCGRSTCDATRSRRSSRSTTSAATC